MYVCVLNKYLRLFTKKMCVYVCVNVTECVSMERGYGGKGWVIRKGQIYEIVAGNL